MNKELEVLEPEVDKDVEHAIDELVNPTKAIILYNDDHNTFPHVLGCLRKYWSLYGASRTMHYDSAP